MSKTLLPAVFLALAAASSARAMPLAVPAAPIAEAPVIKVIQGCGPYGHRDRFGACRPNRPAYGPRFCPPGMHPGPYGQRCFPNR